MSDNMTPFDDLELDSAGLDEIVWVDGYGDWNDMSEPTNRMTIVFTFADSSQLTITGEVPKVPRDSLTEETIKVISMENGTVKDAPDYGFTEQMDMAENSTAIRFLERFHTTLVSELPEREYRPCPDCEDGFASSSVFGATTEDEFCPTCHGRGVILRGIDYD